VAGTEQGDLHEESFELSAGSLGSLDDGIKPEFGVKSAIFAVMIYRADESTMDDIDRRLIALLQANARESTANLARKLGIARTTVVARLARLERSGVIVGYTVRLGLDAGGGGVHAHVGITIEPKASREVLRRLEKLPELRQLSSVSGEVDYIAVLSADTAARLDEVLDELREIEGVRKTTTAVLLSVRIDRRA
jgi:DNA-binding Lrp family transcriptional regulator